MNIVYLNISHDLYSSGMVGFTGMIAFYATD